MKKSLVIACSVLTLGSAFADQGGPRVIQLGGWRTSSSVSIPDQILNTLERRVYVSDLDQDKKYELSLRFSDDSEVILGEFKGPQKADFVVLPKDKMGELAASKAHQVARLIVNEIKTKRDNRELKEVTDENDRPKVYIGGLSIDMNCEHPVLLSDMNGTLDTGDQCTKDSVDELIKTQNIPVFVVSSKGAAAESDLNRIGFDNEDQVVVLDSRGGGYGGTEKAYRILDQVAKAGFCVIGMAGDSESSDGEAAKNLDIPFYAVNKTRIERTPRRVEADQQFCVAKDGVPTSIPMPETNNSNSLYSYNSCPDGYDRAERTQKIDKTDGTIEKVVCQKYRLKKRVFKGWTWDRKVGYSRTIWGTSGNCPKAYTETSRSVPTIGEEIRYAYKKLEVHYRDGSFEKFKNGESQGRYGKVDYCKLEKETETNWNGECPNEEMYDIVTRRVTKTEYDTKEVLDPINLDEYPAGSNQAKNWCDLSPIIEKRIEELKK